MLPSKQILKEKEKEKKTEKKIGRDSLESDTTEREREKSPFRFVAPYNIDIERQTQRCRKNRFCEREKDRKTIHSLNRTRPKQVTCTPRQSAFTRDKARQREKTRLLYILKIVD